MTEKLKRKEYLGWTCLIDSMPNCVQILGKAEFLNPGGSVKDRVAVKIIEEVIFSSNSFV